MENKTDLLVANAGKFVAGGLREILAANFHTAGRGGVEAPKQMHEGGFSAAAGANDRNELTLVDPQVHPVEGPDFLIAHAIDFAEAFEVDEAHDRDFLGLFPDGSGGSTSRTSSPSRIPDWISTLSLSMAPTVTSRRTGIPFSST